MKNEAAERLREYVDTLREPDVLLTEQYQKVGNLLDAALSEERRRTVERIREACRESRGWYTVPTSLLDEIGGSR